MWSKKRGKVKKKKKDTEMFTDEKVCYLGLVSQKNPGTKSMWAKDGAGLIVLAITTSL